MPAITAFPDGDAKSGKFINLTNSLQSLGESGTNLCIETPGGNSEFVLEVFDGDYGGLWDFKRTPAPEVYYSLYADPEGTGSLAVLVERWSSASMTDNGWFRCTSSGSSTGRATSTTRIVNSSDAFDATNGVYRYNLVVAWKDTSLTGNAMNSFKVLVEGRVFGLKESRYGFIGFKWGALFYGGGLPWTFDPETLLFSGIQDPITTYAGAWHFRLDVDVAATVIDFWNGDFDAADDGDDVHSAGVPSWAPSPPAQAEGERDGAPPDDFRYLDAQGVVRDHPYMITTSVAGIYQEVSDEDRNWTARETDPSGNREWEDFQIAVTGFGNDPEYTVSALPAGLYHWEFFGVDAQNTLFLRPQYNLFGEPGDHMLGNRVWLDRNNSGGSDDGDEPGINGVTVNLYLKVNSDYLFYDSAQTERVPDPDNAGEFIDGFYLFEHLAPGDYKVEIDSSTLPGGLTQTYDLDGTSTANVATLSITDADRLDVDFSYYGSGTIGDFIWLDANGNGLQDDGAGSGIANAVVELWIDWEDDGDFILLATDTTDSSGNYLFSGLPAGTYEVVVDGTTLPVGLTLSADPDGGLPNEAGLPLSQSETNLEQDFGYWKKQSGPGTATPGYWKNHPEAWPVDEITIGGRTYSKSEAICLMETSGKGDKTYDLFRHLVSAKLNVYAGNDSSDADKAIKAADCWMKSHPVGSNVKASSCDWKKIEWAYTILDKYNNGELPCADHRD